MTTNNSCNYSLGNVNDQLVMTSSGVQGFRGRSQSSSSRSLNTAFQISSTRDSAAIYSVDISCTSTLAGGQSGTVFLEMATNSGFTTGVQTLSEFTNSNSVSLAIAISVTQINTACLYTPLIPAGNWVRLRTNNNTGTPTFNFQTGQEVLL
jgi:hypothetical protein